MIMFTSASNVMHKRRSLPYAVDLSIQPAQLYDSGDYSTVVDLAPHTALKKCCPKTLGHSVKHLMKKKRRSKKQSTHYQNRILVLNKSTRSVISAAKLPVLHHRFTVQ